MYGFSSPVVTLLAEPDSAATCVSEGLYGEAYVIQESISGFSLIQLQHDNYCGYVSNEQLINSRPYTSPTHRVNSRSTLLFSKPDIKSPVTHRLPFNAALSVTAEISSSIVETACGHFVWSAHLRPNDNFNQESLAAIAQQRFIDSPYLWGGRTANGLDCSGLVQAVAFSTGITLPRDSKDQYDFLDSTISLEDRQADDLAFWPGHVGILIDPDTVVHATAFSLNCQIESFASIVQRSGPASIKRMKRPKPETWCRTTGGYADDSNLAASGGI